ncbi:response regulator [Pontivivens insulae]|uniref:Transcriptional regulatory protein PhoP n=1 Tax=Pontivivens insulae TaxID=1639689 RepID=A0A2R8ABZ8_9RHOB|nr:response regulator [Pontivivens insulae]RED11088.1 response regulator receiver domain-containing protein [Pontivivens insulae]SPF29737.1 Transcriptional regulatory protein PhoP [Pontivivens insulae]
MNVVSLQPSITSAARGVLHAKRVLLVEDSATAAAIMARMIRAAGGRFRRADGVEAAMRHMRSFRPDILIVDPGLPDGDGLDLIAQVSQARFARPRIVVLSGSPMEAEAMAAGADAFLLKPADRASLLSTLICAPVGAGWQQAGDALRPDMRESLVTDLRRAQLCLLEVKLCGRDPDAAQFGYPFLGAVLSLAADPDLASCEAAVEARQLDTVLAELKTWLSRADPIVDLGEDGVPLRSVSYR